MKHSDDANNDEGSVGVDKILMIVALILFVAIVVASIRIGLQNLPDVPIPQSSTN